MRLAAILFSVAAAAAPVLPATADTVIDFNDEFDDFVYYQDGFELDSPSGFSFFFGGDRPALEIDVLITPQPSHYRLVRTDGGMFSLVSFILGPGNDEYVFDVPQNDLRVTGYVGAAEVARVEMTSQGGTVTYDGAGFPDIDRLEFRSLRTPNVLDLFEEIEEDAFLTLDDLTLGDVSAQVPLPPAAAGLGAALTLLVAAARRRRN